MELEVIGALIELDAINFGLAYIHIRSLVCNLVQQDSRFLTNSQNSGLLAYCWILDEVLRLRFSHITRIFFRSDARDVCFIHCDHRAVDRRQG